MQLVQYHDLGSISYQNAWDYQTIVHQKLLHKKLKFNGKDNSRQVHHLIICEHKHVYTLGKSGSMENLLLDAEQLDQKGIEFFKINRGGDITYHGEGQLTVYPIFDLECFNKDVHKYVRNLEQVVINLLGEYNITGTRNDGYTGVWIETNNGNKMEKICAIGVHLSRWVSLHGIALNVNTNLGYFDNIIPCGIAEENKSVCSIQSLLKRKIPLEEVKAKLRVHFAQVFDYSYI